jgi:hypothetical protein
MQVTIECFKTLRDYKNNPAYRKGNGKAGVYVWGFSLENADFTTPTTVNKFFPYYVGKHYKDMYSRTHEHVTYLSGGNFSIFDVLQCVKDKTKIGTVQKCYQNASNKGGISGGPRLPNSQFQNLIYFPEGVHRQYDFFFDTTGVIPKQIDWMLKHFCILYINPINVYHSKNINDLEKIIGNLIGYDNLITKKYKYIPEDLKIEIVHNSKIAPLEKLEDLFTHCTNNN